MVSFPNCKINLGLQILRKRPDGFHDLQTVFYPIPLTDALEIIQTDEKKTTLSLSGLSIDAKEEDNISIKAYQILKKDFSNLPAIKLHLHKVIPSGAGLGGGSADGAFTLLLLNQKFNLGLTEEQLINYALQLGSDCPFFIKNKPCFAKGRGEDMEAIDLDLSSYKIALVNPRIHVATGWAFSQLTPNDQRPSLKNIIQQPVEIWKEQLINDFEPAIFKQYPEIEKIKTSLYEQGAVYASMTGTGSTVFAFFKKRDSTCFQFSFALFYSPQLANCNNSSRSR